MKKYTSFNINSISTALRYLGTIIVLHIACIDETTNYSRRISMSISIGENMEGCKIYICKIILIR